MTINQLFLKEIYMKREEITAIIENNSIQQLKRSRIVREKLIEKRRFAERIEKRKSRNRSKFKNSQSKNKPENTKSIKEKINIEYKYINNFIDVSQQQRFYRY
jgi:hypothetical protein